VSSECRVSVVVPAFNEAGNILPLVEAMAKMYNDSGLSGEMVLVNDGSTDDTLAVALSLADKHTFLRVVSYQPNRGLTYALETGFKAARGAVLVFYPADLQYSPDDIPRLVARLDEGFDIVTGWKQGNYSKKRVSAVYNWLSQVLFRIDVHDMNSVKAFRKEVLDVLDFRADFHRYMVVMAVQGGFRAGEVKVPLYERKSGRSKFAGPGRVLIGFMDLLAVWFQYSFLKKPLLFFGAGGVVCFATGLLLALAALYLRYVMQMGFRPMLTLVSMLISLGVLLFGLGFLGESIQDTNRRLSRIEADLKRARKKNDEGSHVG
jgi:glycosyltransferase involved in cell wall biosynthesis